MTLASLYDELLSRAAMTGNSSGTASHAAAGVCKANPCQNKAVSTHKYSSKAGGGAHAHTHTYTSRGVTSGGEPLDGGKGAETLVLAVLRPPSTVPPAA